MTWDLNPTGSNCLSLPDISGTSYTEAIKGRGHTQRQNTDLLVYVAQNRSSVVTWLYITWIPEPKQSPPTEKKGKILHISLYFCLQSLETI